MSFPAFGAFLLALLAIILISAIAWIIFIHLRARRLGLPTPTLTSYNPFASRSSYTPQARTGGLIGWISDKFRNIRARRSRTAGGAYEEPLGAYGGGGGGAGGGGARSGFGALDPDEAWDARVGNEADYYREEQEVGLHAETGYGGAGGEERGRTRGRRGDEGPYGGEQGELDRRYEEEMAGQQTGVTKKSESRNPFDDSAAVGTSLRGVSPRPDKSGENEGLGGDPDSPTGKRSSFREVM